MNNKSLAPALELKLPRARWSQRSFLHLPWIPGIPFAFLSVIIIATTVGSYWLSYSPTLGSLGDQLTPPAWLSGGTSAHLLGTDRLGRDILTRVIYGARISLLISSMVVILSASIGTMLGLISGYAGGFLDSLLMRLTDVVLALPIMLVAIVLASIFEPSIPNLVLLLVVLLWAQYARVVRAVTLSHRERDYVIAAYAIGCSRGRVMLRHILPNVFDPIVVMATLQLGSVILLEASLSYLGVGIPPPTPAWGLMINEGRDYATTAWWISFFPGVVLACVILSVNLFGDWLRDRTDPQHTVSSAT